MSKRKASEIELSEKQEKILKEMARGTHTRLHFKIRSQVILKAASGSSNNTIETDMQISAKKVKRWRDRYSVMREELQQIEKETPHKLRRTIEEILSDAQRPGGPAKFTDEQVAVIIAISLKDPMEYELPFSHWTPSLLQREVIKKGIVETISVRQVGRFLKKSGSSAAPKPLLA
jgi:putative transposase